MGGPEFDGIGKGYFAHMRRVAGLRLEQLKRLLNRFVLVLELLKLFATAVDQVAQRFIPRLGTDGPGRGDQLPGVVEVVDRDGFVHHLEDLLDDAVVDARRRRHEIVVRQRLVLV